MTALLVSVSLVPGTVGPWPIQFVSLYFATLFKYVHACMGGGGHGAHGKEALYQLFCFLIILYTMEVLVVMYYLIEQQYYSATVLLSCCVYILNLAIHSGLLLLEVPCRQDACNS